MISIIAKQTKDTTILVFYKFSHLNSNQIPMDLLHSTTHLPHFIHSFPSLTHRNKGFPFLPILFNIFVFCKLIQNLSYSKRKLKSLDLEKQSMYYTFLSICFNQNMGKGTINPNARTIHIYPACCSSLTHNRQKVNNNDHYH